MKSLVYAVLVLLAACGGASPRTEGPRVPPDPLELVEPSELFERGSALADQGDLIRAEQYLTAAMRRGHPEDVVIPILVRVCLAGSRPRAALSYAVPHLARHPDDWALRQLVASLHLAIGDVDRAEAEIREVLHQSPDRASAEYMLAVLLRDERKDPDAARHHFERYAELDPRGPHVAEARMWSGMRTVPRTSASEGEAPSSEEVVEP